MDSANEILERVKRIERLLEEQITPKAVKRFYNVKEAAVELNVSVKSVRRFIERGFLKPCRALHKLMIPLEDIEGFKGATR